MCELEHVTMAQRLTKYVRSLIARPRLLMAVAVALICYLLLTPYLRASQAVLLAFDLGSIFFLTSIVHLMSKATPVVMRCRADRFFIWFWIAGEMIVSNRNNLFAV
jgi:hypothetical protein